MRKIICDDEALEDLVEQHANHYRHRAYQTHLAGKITNQLIMRCTEFKLGIY
jgi:hypothetical protein